MEKLELENKWYSTCIEIIKGKEFKNDLYSFCSKRIDPELIGVATKRVEFSGVSEVDVMVMGIVLGIGVSFMHACFKNSNGNWWNS